MNAPVLRKPTHVHTDTSSATPTTKNICETLHGITTYKMEALVAKGTHHI